MRYDRLEEFVAPARPTSEIWRTLLGLVAIGLVYLVLTAALMWLAVHIPDPFLRDSLALQMMRGTGPLWLIFQLLAIGLLVPATMIVTRLLLRRPGWTLFGIPGRFGRDFRRAMIAALAVIALVLVLPPSEYPVEPEPGLPFERWLVWLPLAVPAIFLQVTAEEVVFRGYLLSQLAARFRSPLVWMTAPAAAFAVLHYVPGAGAGNFVIMLWAFAFGILAADLVARTGSLGAPIGLHFANNLTAMLFVAISGHADGLALYRLPVELSDAPLLAQMMVVDILALVCTWLAARLVLRV